MIDKCFIENETHLSILQLAEGTIFFTKIIEDKLYQNIVAIKDVTYDQKHFSYVL